MHAREAARGPASTNVRNRRARARERSYSETRNRVKKGGGDARRNDADDNIAILHANATYTYNRPKHLLLF